jgi:hypothetical protein
MFSMGGRQILIIVAGDSVETQHWSTPLASPSSSFSGKHNKKCNNMIRVSHTTDVPIQRFRRFEYRDQSAKRHDNDTYEVVSLDIYLF